MLTPQKTQQGFGLIEMMVAGFVITFGLVGMVLMQGHTQRNTFNAHSLSLAGLYAQDLQERLRANMCFLSPAISDASDPEELVKFINDDLDDFLDDLRAHWQSNHFTEGRSGWEATLGRDENWDESDVLERGYWRFDLEISGQGIEMNQRLLVEYKQGGCQ